MFFLKILSLFPTSILYLLSDLLYFLSRYVFRYRKKVILENLRKSFPEKSDKDLEKICGEFYRNLTDLIVETLKILSLSEKELNRRVKLIDIELPLSHLKSGKSIIALAGHLCNWEWLLAACTSKGDGFPVDAVYKPLKSQFTDRLMLKIRSKFGSTPVPMKDVLREQIKKKTIPHTLAMVADQTPTGNEIQFWYTFLHQDTAFYIGADKIGRMLSMPVFFIGMRRIKRGSYEIYFREIATPPFPEEENYVIKKYAEMLEEEIRKQPANWLWSHRRWKHQRFKN
jgi:KDO2-lipid IV(A) lauroyltransferase